MTPFLTSRLEPIESLAIDADDLKRLRAAGIHTVDDLEQGDAADIATRLQAYWITADVIGCWQRQSSLMRQVSGLTPTAARMLVGAGFHDAMQVARADINSIHQQVVAFAATTQGRRYLLHHPVPTREQVLLWVQHIKSNLHGPPDAVTIQGGIVPRDGTCFLVAHVFRGLGLQTRLPETMQLTGRGPILPVAWRIQ